MPFDTLTSRLKRVASTSLSFCKHQYGANGLKVEESIDKAIGWQPTFFLRPTRFLILAVEVSDLIYPDVLKGAAHDISHFDTPITVYQACPLDAYQNDPAQAKVNLLRRHGFGIITVDDDGAATIQHPGVPLAEHISPEMLEQELSGLNSVLKVKLKAAYQTYRSNVGQGLQEAGQLIEALLHSIARQAAKQGWIPKAKLSDPLANIIDELYTKGQFRNHRAALGGARDFVKEYRNTASHAPKSARQATERIKKCKAGFLDAISVAKKLRCATQSLV
jgi:hypothetical protein